MRHNCNHSNCEHEDSKEGFAKGSLCLWPKIDIDNIQCLNESVDGSGKRIFKTWDSRLDKTLCVESDVDAELLFNIPFTGIVKLKSLVIIGGEGNTHPLELKLYKNRPTMSFHEAAMKADQEFMLHPDLLGNIDYPVKASVFSSIYHLTIYVPGNLGAEHTKIYYIGLFGEYMRPFRENIAICNYELSANPCDHRVGKDIISQVQIR